MADMEEASKRKHSKGDKIKVTKTMHKVNAGAQHTVHSVHYGYYYGVRSAGQGLTYIPHQHTEPCAPPTPPDPGGGAAPAPGGGSGTGPNSMDVTALITENWLDHIVFLLQ